MYAVTEDGLGLAKDAALGIVGAYGAVVYLAAVLGGWIADRVFGMQRTVLGGGVVMHGHISLAVLPHLGGLGVGIVLIAIGAPVRSRPTVPRCSWRSGPSWTSGRPRTPREFAHGMMGMPFLTVAGGTGRSRHSPSVFGLLPVFAVSELLLSPIELSVATKLAPEAFGAR